MRVAPRHLTAALIALGLGLAACADPHPPVGRWEGAYEDANLIIVARLEITSEGAVRVSAPNAITEGPALSPAERSELLQHLQSGLAASWSAVSPLPLEFDGSVFRKPGGVAPQLEWDEEHKRMTMVYYSGTRASVRVPMTSVAEFAVPNS
jgi:hypothetical protein